MKICNTGVKSYGKIKLYKSNIYWLYQNRSKNGWWVYDERSCEELEKMYLEYLNSCDDEKEQKVEIGVNDNNTIEEIVRVFRDPENKKKKRYYNNIIEINKGKYFINFEEYIQINAKDSKRVRKIKRVIDEPDIINKEKIIGVSEF